MKGVLVTPGWRSPKIHGCAPFGSASFSSRRAAGAQVATGLDEVTDVWDSSQTDVWAVGQELGEAGSTALIYYDQP